MTILKPILPNYIDATMMSCFRSCPRKFYNEFVLGLRPAGVSVDLHAGGAFAKALEVVRYEVFVNHRDMAEALLRGHAAFDMYWGNFTIPEFKTTTKHPDRVWEAVVQYFNTFPPLMDHIQPYMVDGKPTFEFTFAIPLDMDGGGPVEAWPVHPETGEPFLYSGRCDMVGEYMGLPIVCDDKTMGQSPGQNWSEKWDLRSQFIGYTWAAQQLGMEVDSVAVRGVGILMKSINLAEAIKPYSDYLRAMWLEQLRRDLWKIVECWSSGYWDYNLAETCTSYGLCPYSTSCQSANPNSWLETFDVRRWNPIAIDPTATTLPSEAAATISSPEGQAEGT